MKRDFDLIRKILRSAEEAPALTPQTGFTFDGFDDETTTEHIELLIEAGLLVGSVTRFLSGGGQAIVVRLTWNGHDFLEASKDDTIWNKAKETILKPLGGVAFEVLLEWLKLQMKERLGMPSPIH